MSNLPNNTTLDGKRIITETESNNHRHSASQIMGLSDSAIGDSFVYAEFIDGVSYSQLQNEFISDSSNIMTGTLTILTNSNNENNIINVVELDTLKSSSGIRDYDISDIPPVEEVNTAQRSIMVTGQNTSVDLSWTPSSVSSTVPSISMSGPEQVTSSNQYVFTINNYNSFNEYSVVVSNGSANLNTDLGIIQYNSPSIAPNQENVTLTVTNLTTNVSKEIIFTLQQDADIQLSYYNGTSYELIVGNISVSNGDDILIRIDTFNPGYNYNVTTTSSKLSLSRTDDIITVSLPENNPTASTETLTVSREGDSIDVNIDLSVYSSIYNTWAVSTIGGSQSDSFQSSIGGPNGTNIAVGYQMSDTPSTGDLGAFIVHYDSNMDVIKQITLDGPVHDRLRAVCYANTSGYIVAGDGMGSAEGNAYIAHVDENLNIVNEYSASFGYGSSSYFDVKPLSTGGYVAVGYGVYSTSHSNYSPMISLFDNNLQLISNRFVNEDTYSYFTCVTETHDNQIVAWGVGNCPIIKFDLNLNILIQKEYNDSTSTLNMYSIVKNNSSGYLAAGAINPDTAINKGYLIEFDSNLNITNSVSLQQNSNSTVFKKLIAKSDLSGFMVSGYYRDSSNYHASFIAQYDNNLTLDGFNRGLAGDGNVYFDSINETSDGGYFLAGSNNVTSVEGDTLAAKIPNDLSNIIVPSSLNNHPTFQWINPVFVQTNISLSLANTSYSSVTSTVNQNGVSSTPYENFINVTKSTP